MDWIILISIVVGAWAVLSVFAGERLARAQQIALATAAVAEHAKAVHKKRSVQAAVAAVAKMEAAGK